MNVAAYLAAAAVLYLVSRRPQREQRFDAPSIQRPANAARDQIRVGVREMQADWARTTGSVVQSPPIPSTIPWEEGQMRRADLARLAGMLAEVGAPFPYSPDQLASPDIAREALAELAAALRGSPPLRRGLGVLYAGGLL